ncbi:MAG: RNA polymerase sporulation sigma factor SigK [Bacilli bacterium]|nr:RNA polymerase sporulation sigma factor SigK [Bacilli bacterium]MDY4996713.1 RNA polymerase sporulation sigma factor SigK [Bacilli bacterium]
MFLSLFHLIISHTFFMGSYSNEVFPDPLSKEEEEEYIKKMKEGDSEARNQLILHNLRLVAHIVKKFETSGNDVDDLIGIGTVGLIKGIDTYSVEKKVKLTTYAAKCAENEILMYFRSNKKNAKNVSIYDGVSYDKEGNEITVLDVLKTKDPDYLEDIYLKDNILLLRKYLNILSKRERKIINMRYGLEHEEEKTQKEIASALGISRSYVSRIEKRAITKILREFIRNKNYNG